MGGVMNKKSLAVLSVIAAITICGLTVIPIQDNLLLINARTKEIHEAIRIDNGESVELDYTSSWFKVPLKELYVVTIGNKASGFTVKRLEYSTGESAVYCNPGYYQSKPVEYNEKGWLVIEKDFYMDRIVWRIGDISKPILKVKGEEYILSNYVNEFGEGLQFEIKKLAIKDIALILLKKW